MNDEAEKLEYTKYKIRNLVDVSRDGKHWFRGQISKVLDRGIIINDIAGIKDGFGFNEDVLAGSYIPFFAPEINYKFSVVK